MLGEDIGAYGGAFKVTEGFHRALRCGSRDRHADRRGDDRRDGGRRRRWRGSVRSPSSSTRTSCRAGSTRSRRSSRATTTGAACRCRSCSAARRAAACARRPSTRRTPSRGSPTAGGIKIVCPAFPGDAKGLLKSAIRDDNPVLFLEHKWIYRRIKEQVPEDPDFLVPIGKADVKREGDGRVDRSRTARWCTRRSRPPRPCGEGHLGRGRRPANRLSARRGDRPPVDREDSRALVLSRVLPVRRDRRRGRRHDRGEGVRASRRARRATVAAERAGAVLPDRSRTRSCPGRDIEAAVEQLSAW